VPERARGYAHRVDIGAALDDVWQALLDPKLLAQWYGVGARIDRREGGSYWIRVGEDLVREAHIDVYRPPNRLRLIYMPLAELPDEGVVVDDFLIDQAHDDAPVVLRLLGSGIPENRAWDPMYVRLRVGWERALIRLKALLEQP